MKTHIRLFAAGLILVAAFWVSCKKKSNEPTPSSTNGNTNQVTFLKAGATYNYLYTDFLQTNTPVKMVVEQEIAQDTFLVRNFSSVLAMIPTQYYVINNNTLSASFRLRDKTSYQVLCKFNAPVGTNWTFNNFGTPYTYTIIGVNVSVTTGSGVISDAVQVRAIDNASDTTYAYYSPTVGPLGTIPYKSTNYGMQLISYTQGVASTNVPATVPAITFGSFPFLKTGNYWTYYESEFGSVVDTITITVSGKSTQNVFTISTFQQSTDSTSISYWFEDDGLLMNYASNESLSQADPIYMNPASAKTGYGWTVYSETGSPVIHTIGSLDSSGTSTYYGNFSGVMAENASNNGLYVQLTNFWDPNKGIVYSSGIVSEDLYQSNLRTARTTPLHIPGFTIH